MKMDRLVESVERLQYAETGTLIVQLELNTLRYEMRSIDPQELREALRDAQEEYENELDVLHNLLSLFAPTRYRRGVIDVDRRLGRQLDDVMAARAAKDDARQRWWRGTSRRETLRELVTQAEAELENLKAVEQLTREDCYEPIVELARVWMSCQPRSQNQR